MYILITFVHILFIFSAHLLSFYILEWIFIFLFAFFLLYFSPLFFTKEKINFPAFSLDIFSPKKSITLPLLLLYWAIYIFLFALFSEKAIMLSIGIYTLIAWFLLFFWYMLITDWKNDIFFDVTRIHLMMSYIVIYSLLFVGFFTEVIITKEILFLLLLTIIFSFYFFHVSRVESVLFFQSFIIIFILSFYLVWLFAMNHFFTEIFFTNTSLIKVFLSIICILSIILFEIIPKISFFKEFLIESKITTLWLILFSNIGIMSLSIFDFTFFPVIIIALLFLLSVHSRYCNYVSFVVGILSVFFLYGDIFSSLITATSIFSSLLFVFFLPLCIIGSTYFWDEKFPYDFSILHYTSIAFSSIFSLFIIFFVWWGSLFFFLISGIIFLTGILLLLSYFRFRYS